MFTNKSSCAFAEARKHIPGGVNSPVRAFKSVGMEPLFMSRALGSKVFDIDGNEYVDYVGSWGPAILGHAHPEVIETVKEVASAGLTFGAPTELETRLAEKIKSLVPSVGLVRLVSSGTEACMSAIRLARGFTGKEKIIKFEGNYHGHGDMLLVKAGSGVATQGLPDSPGVTKGTAAETLSVPFGNLDAVEDLLKEHEGQVACVIVEPIAGNCGFIKPPPKFLEGLRKLCDQFGSLLIFDEVMTGFRVALGGAQSIFGITPDLTCFGKVIGGGMPLAAYCGRAEIMQMVAPSGPVYQAGTLSGNPVAVACGLKTLEILERDNIFEKLSVTTGKLADGLKDLARVNDVALQTDFAGGMFGMFFSGEKVSNFDQAKSADLGLFNKFFKLMLGSGVYLAPSAFEAGFVSAAHNDADIDFTLAAAQKVFESFRDENG